jgi:hypothetical protein
VSSDEAEIDFKRTLELTGERWLSHSEAVALLRDREPMSVGHAEDTLDDLRKRYFAGERTGLRWHWFRDDGLLSKPTRGNTFVNEADLIYWHDRNRIPTPAATPPEPQKLRRPRRDKVVQAAAEQRLLVVFRESHGVPPADLQPKDILKRVNEGLSPAKHFLRDTVARAVQNLKEKAKQNQ